MKRWASSPLHFPDGSINLYVVAYRLAFFWTWYATTRRAYIPVFSVSLVAARLDWVSLGVL